MALHLGLDLGGTNVKTIVLSLEDGVWERVWAGTTETRADEGPAAIVRQLIEVGAAAIERTGPVASAGVTIPGTFDPVTGTATFVTNLGGHEWRGIPVAAPVEQALGVPIALINDARAFGYGEATLGAARGCRTAAFFTLGTGIGGAVVVDRMLHLGLGDAGELGHQTVDPSHDAPMCACGNRGCLEAHAQASAIARKGGRETAGEVIEAAKGGDERALAALEDVGRWLGIGIGIVIVALNPELVVVGGGIAAAGDLILGPARAEIRRRVHITDPGRVQVVQAELGYEAGAIGAAAWSERRTRPD